MKKSIAFIIVVIIIIIFYMVNFCNKIIGCDLSKMLDTHFGLLFLLVLLGSIGGLLYSISDGELAMPKMDKENDVFKPGWFSDIAFGSVGAILVFLIIPFNEISSSQLSVIEFIKIVSLAIVGGYGGRGILEKVLESVMKKEVAALKEEKKNTKEAVKLVEQYLEKGELPHGENIDSVRKRIVGAEEEVRTLIFYMAKSYRSENWRHSQNYIAHALPIFEALLEKAIINKYKILAELGYLYKDLEAPQYKAAFKNLDEAIKLRPESPDKNSTEWLMEFNRAISRIGIYLESNNEELIPLIQKDIEKSYRNSQYVKGIINKFDDKILVGFIIKLKFEKAKKFFESFISQEKNTDFYLKIEELIK